MSIEQVFDVYIAFDVYIIGPGELPKNYQRGLWYLAAGRRIPAGARIPGGPAEGGPATKAPHPGSFGALTRVGGALRRQG